MGSSWEYKVITLKKKGSGLFVISNIPNDGDSTSILNREGAEGWELVSAVSPQNMAPLKLFFKRPR